MCWSKGDNNFRAEKGECSKVTINKNKNTITTINRKGREITNGRGQKFYEPKNHPVQNDSCAAERIATVMAKGIGELAIL